ncbi:MAG: hypothetical protein PHC64_03745 [Candidatus Gastranaerophilales bacterium]|nr:hypothetical protein [Candidatus Gastranaerophilales bacterium]
MPGVGRIELFSGGVGRYVHLKAREAATALAQAAKRSALPNAELNARSAAKGPLAGVVGVQNHRR